MNIRHDQSEKKESMHTNQHIIVNYLQIVNYNPDRKFSEWIAYGMRDTIVHVLFLWPFEQNPFSIMGVRFVRQESKKLQISQNQS